MKYSFPNPFGNEWIDKYNALVDEIARHEYENKQLKKTQPKRDDKKATTGEAWGSSSIGIHHIIPKKINPGLEKDKNNWLYVSFSDHCTLHYYLWKADPQYAIHLWFILLAARKFGWWELPGGEEEYEQIKADIQEWRRKKKEGNT